jgi:hypothetical protein
MTRPDTELFLGLDHTPTPTGSRSTRCARDSTTWRSESPVGKTWTLGSPTSTPWVRLNQRPAV